MGQSKNAWQAAEGSIEVGPPLRAATQSVGPRAELAEIALITPLGVAVIRNPAAKRTAG